MGTPVIGIMGVLTDWKGHRVLLQALATLPDVRCEIAGSAFHADADYEMELRQMAEAPELAGRVTFLGHVDPLPTMRRWNVLVSASTSPEASPVVVLEAMSLGVPVIAATAACCAAVSACSATNCEIGRASCRERVSSPV
mgnify:CR=1 FL=1